MSNIWYAIIETVCYPFFVLQRCGMCDKRFCNWWAAPEYVNAKECVPPCTKRECHPDGKAVNPR